MEITRLIPQQVMEYWPQIKECINTALPPHVKNSDESMLKIQEQLLVGKLECWMAHAAGNQAIVYAVATTCFVVDEISETKNLLVYTLATLNPHSQDLWTTSYEVLARYAAAKGCQNILAYSDLPEVRNIVARLGGNCEWQLLYFPLG